MIYKTYVLISKSCKKTYVGHTNDLERRLIEHNDGKTIFSKRYRPWSVLYEEEFGTEAESIDRERYFKSAAGRRWIKKMLFSDRIS